MHCHALCLKLFNKIVLVKKIIKMESKKRNTTWGIVGVIFFVTGIGIILMGWLLFYVSDLKQTDVELRDYSIPKETEINFRDFEPMREWMVDAEITSYDENTLEVGKQKLLQVFVDSPNPPLEFVVHIYHEDIDGYFTDEEDPSAFRQVTEQLNRVPYLAYGSIFHIELDTKEYWNCIKEEKENCNNLLQNRQLVSFPRAGKYFVQFSAKLDENQFDHRRSPDSLTTISDPREIRLEEQLSSLQKSTDLLYPSLDKSLGIAIIGIGSAFMVAGIAFVRKN